MEGALEVPSTLPWRKQDYSTFKELKAILGGNSF